ncbi:bifunctional metallophosphatase/5'-nucleotidase [Enterococcus sp. DIV1304_2]|uniref:bifunctional metallophosphatase/5'-nucleotidase n=1 Tax=unclassified Enterococcus TaxID=2608891 RepID=UPI003D2FA1B8
MEVTILATSDMHGYVLPTNYANDLEQPFGVAKVAGKVKELREAASGPVFMIENGDFIQGSPLSYFVAKQPEYSVSTLTKLLNGMNYDVGVLGNHEFNYGWSYLNEAIQSYDFPIVVANMLRKNQQESVLPPYQIIEKQGIKVAVLGLVTQYIPNWENPETIKDLHFVSAVETAKKYVPLLRELADLVVVAYHGGFEKDLTTNEPTEAMTGENEGSQLLQEVPGIDALVTGHQHREIAEVVNGVPVIQPGYRGAFVGAIKLTVKKQDNKFIILDHSCKLYPTKEASPDPIVLEQVAPVSKALDVWLDQPVGEVLGDLRIIDPMAARVNEHPYIELINRIQMDATGAEISGTALFNNEVTGFPQSVSMRHILTNYIYPNTLAVVRVTGQELKAALEQTAGYLTATDEGITFDQKYIQPKPQYYNYDMYEGINYTIDLNQPIGHRVTRFEKEGEPIPLDKSLEVVINQYRAVGGGNYKMFSAEKIVKECPIDMTELIAEYFKRKKVIEAKVDHNFIVIGK